MPAQDHLNSTKSEATKVGARKKLIPGFQVLKFTEGTKFNEKKADDKKNGITFFFEIDGGDFAGEKVYYYISESQPKDGKDTANMTQFFRLIDASGQMMPYIKKCQAKQINPDNPLSDADTIKNVVNIVNTLCVGKVMDSILEVDERPGKDKDGNAIWKMDDAGNHELDAKGEKIPVIFQSFRLAQFSAYGAGILAGSGGVKSATTSGAQTIAPAEEDEEIEV